jgi:hypothetical protein
MLMTVCYALIILIVTMATMLKFSTLGDNVYMTIYYTEWVI